MLLPLGLLTDILSANYPRGNTKIASIRTDSSFAVVARPQLLLSRLGPPTSNRFQRKRSNLTKMFPMGWTPPHPPIGIVIDGRSCPSVCIDGLDRVLVRTMFPRTPFARIRQSRRAR